MTNVEAIRSDICLSDFHETKTQETIFVVFCYLDMRSTLDIDVTSFYKTQFKRLKWALNDQTENETEIAIEEESVTDKSEIRGAIEDHIDHITAALPEGRVLNDYEVTISFDPDIDDRHKAEFTTIFNEFNTRDESN